MENNTHEGWATFPKELLFKIFTYIGFHDRRLLHPLSQVCSQWSNIIKKEIFTDYTEYLNDVKINLKFKKIVNNNVVVNNLFTCFHLAEYDKDFLFWPKQTADNMVYCSEIRGNFQIISYEITSSFIDFIKLTDSDYVATPIDCNQTPYQEFNDVSPFSGSRDNELEIIRNNTYPTFKLSRYTVCLYMVNIETTKSTSLTYLPNTIRFYLNTNKRVNYATISQNNKYLVLAFSGLIQVYRLPTLKLDTSIDLNCLSPYFSKQQPSVVKYLSIDDNGQVLFLKSLRLGGLSIINLITGEELDFPHYRLELNMSSQLNDHIILLTGYNETIIYGLPKKPQGKLSSSITESKYSQPITVTQEDDDDYLKNIKKLKLLPDEVPIWNYFENHINASLELMVSSNNILPVDAPGCFVSLVKGYQFPQKSESIFSGSTNDRSIDLVLLIDKNYPKNLNHLKGQYLEDFFEEDINNDHDTAQVDDHESPNSDGEDDSEDDSFEDDDELASQFTVVPLIYNIQYLSRSSLLSVSGDGKRFAILINNLLFIMNVSAESILLILEKFNTENFQTLDLLKVFNVYTDPTDFRLELATSVLPSSNPNSSSMTFTYANKLINANIFFIDELLHLPEYREQHKRFNNNSTAIDSDDDDDENGDLLSDDLATSDAESVTNGEGLRHSNVASGYGSRSRISERKPQLIWQGNDKIAINFSGSLTILLSLDPYFDF